MGFKCRLFGHTYGNPEVERSRKEEGDEVVVTIRNVKRCERCGDEKMVNQTKEVTSVRSPEEVGLDTPEGTSTAPGPPDATDTTPETSEPGPDPGRGDGDSPVTPVEAGSDPTPAAEAEPAATPDPETPVDATVGPDVELGADAAADPAGVAPDNGAVAADDDAAAQGGRGVDDHPDPADSPEAADGWDEDEAVEAVEDVEAVDAADAADAAGAPTTEPAEESPAAEATDDGWETGSDDWDDVDPDPNVDDAVILDAEETERDEVQWPEESDASPDGATDTAGPADAADLADSNAPEPAAEPPANDAEIIDAGESATGGDPAEATAGGWPEHEDTDAAGGWPDHDTADEGYSAAPNGDIDTEFGGNGLTPEVNGGTPDDPAAVDGIAVGEADSGTVERTAAEPGNGTDPEPGEGFVRAGESATGDVPADQVEFYCPNCGHARVAGASSIRAGDICPECKRGYIAERER
jgi:predicted RNA-binding Zn-ribbon protein involved in translation (DUF1610 family)